MNREEHDKRILSEAIAKELEKADVQKLRFIYRFVIRYLA